MDINRGIVTSKINMSREAAEALLELLYGYLLKYHRDNPQVSEDDCSITFKEDENE